MHTTLARPRHGQPSIVLVSFLIVVLCVFFDCWWCVVVLKRHSSIVRRPGRTCKHVRAPISHPTISEGVLGHASSPTQQNQESRGLIQTIAGQVHLGTGDPCRLHATASWVCLLRSTIKLLSSSSFSSSSYLLRSLIKLLSSSSSSFSSSLLRRTVPGRAAHPRGSP